MNDGTQPAAGASASDGPAATATAYEQPGEEEIQAIHRELRATFRTGITKSRSWRIKTLKAFRRMIIEGREELQAALHADLHKHPNESFLCEINMVEHDIQLALDDLEKWMAPKSVSTDLANVLGGGRSMIQAEPLGVVRIDGAWNYPVVLTLQPLVGAIAAGNCAIVKCASPKYSRATSETMIRLSMEYFDPSVIRFIGGDRYVTQALNKCQWDYIFFTGSPANGRRIARAAAEFLTPCTLELGGKSPCIVHRDVDVAVAAKRIVFGAFLNSGQTCIRPDYIVAHADVLEALIDACSEATAQFYSATPRDSPHFGRVINRGAWSRINALLEPERESGRIVLGGEADEATKYIAPTLVNYGSDWGAFESSPLMQEEIFGPVLPMCSYQDVDDVVSFVNDREKPLVVHVFTNSSTVSDKVVQGTSSGTAVVNDTMVWMANNCLPFGGVGNSGLGTKYHGRGSFECFSHMKSVMVKSMAIDLAAPWRYQPWSGQLQMTILNIALHSWPAARIRAAKLVCLAVLLLLAKRAGIFGAVRAALLRLLQ